jgi:hypothetical protein
MNKLAVIFAFVAGAAVGTAASWKFFETKYKKIADEEIESVKETFNTKKYEWKDEFNTVLAEKESEEDENTEEPRTNEKPDIREYAAKLSKEGYTNYRNINAEKETKEDVKPMTKEPYVISPDEFGENEYETRSLTYYEDGILTDEDDNPIEDVEGMIGSEALDSFGEYEDDAVHVRDDDLKIDYEILRDAGRYYE